MIKYIYNMRIWLWVERNFVMILFNLKKKSSQCKNNIDTSSLIRKKTLKWFVLGIIFGGLIFGGIGVVALTLTANQVSYSPSDTSFNVENVNDALNELYKLSSTSSSGSFTVIDLGTGRQFNVSSYDGYKNFTKDNFIVEPVGNSSAGVGNNALQPGTSHKNFWPSGTYKLTKDYDETTGILKSSGKLEVKLGSSEGGVWGPWSQTKDVHAYLILK